jgi:predicted nuclease of predicted toxin-antitoxin system
LRYLVDECLGHSVVRNLREDGHDVKWVGESSKGISDEMVLAWSVAENRVLPTQDFDYGELIFGRGHSAIGVVIVQIADFSGSWEETAAAIVKRLADLQHGLAGHLTVIGRERVKSRELRAR